MNYSVASSASASADGLALAIKYSSTYLVTICVAIGVFVNPINIIIWSKPVRGVSWNARLYYVVLSLAETPNVFTFYPLAYSLGLGLPTSGMAFTPQVDSNVCKTIWFIWLSSEMIACWALCALCFERLYAVYKPMLVQATFTRRRLKIFAVSLILVSYASNVPAFYVNRADSGRCGNVFDLGLLGVLRFWQAQLSCMAIPVMLAVAGNVTLVLKIEREAKKRAGALGLKKGTKGAAKERLASTIVVVISVCHIFFYVPSNVATITMDMAGSFYPLWSGNAAALRFSSLWQSFTVIPHCLNFFVYVSLIPGYREKFNALFCPGCTTSGPKTADDKDDSAVMV